MSVFVDVQQLVTKPIGQSNWRESIQDPYTSQKHETINVFGQALNDLQPNANKVSTWPICIGEGPKAMAQILSRHSVAIESQRCPLSPRSVNKFYSVHNSICINKLNQFALAEWSMKMI